MKKLNLSLILVCVLVAVGCREELLTGPVRGIINSYNHNNNALDDNSGIEIKLMHDSVEAGITVTDAAGWFRFDDVPYGRYSVTYSREGNIRPYSIPQLNHAGGGVPLYMNYSIYEVPSFTLDLDSVRPGRDDFEKMIYLRIDGDTIMPDGGTFLPPGYASYFILFASESPDVSSSNFKARAKGYMTNWEPFPWRRVSVRGMVSYLEDISYTFGSTDSIYLRAYPLAWGQGYNFNEYLPGALGKPSNVIKCKWPQ